MLLQNQLTPAPQPIESTAESKEPLNRDATPTPESNDRVCHTNSTTSICSTTPVGAVDSVQILIANICDYFLLPNEEESLKNNRKTVSSLIRVHNEKLKSNGDVSFSATKGTWQNYFQNTGEHLNDRSFELFENEESEEVRKEARENFIAVSKKWSNGMRVERISVQNGRCSLFLARNVVITQLLNQVLAKPAENEYTYGQLRKNPQRRVYLRKQKDEQSTNIDLSQFRAKLIENALWKILQYSEWTIESDKNCLDDKKRPEDDQSEVLCVQTLSVASKGFQRVIEASNDQQRCATIKCGIVIDPGTGKSAKLDAKEYIALRSNDMRLMAMHKYGIRAKDDARFCALMERLGEAAVTVDLLEVKHTSPVQIIRNGQGSTKGASFILYNSARLETLLRAFDERVENVEYGQLPDLNVVDFSLLNEEEEWQLVFGYIFTFPNLIERCVEQLERGQCATHLIIHFLSGFVSIFSVYYRRIRILIESRDHLMPLIYARIYLVKAVREILNKTLALLDIEPVLFM